jgi:hypothetical protein
MLPNDTFLNSTNPAQQGFKVYQQRTTIARCTALFELRFGTGNRDVMFEIEHVLNGTAVGQSSTVRSTAKSSATLDSLVLIGDFNEKMNVV